MESKYRISSDAGQIADFLADAASRIPVRSYEHERLLYESHQFRKVESQFRYEESPSLPDIDFSWLKSVLSLQPYDNIIMNMVQEFEAIVTDTDSWAN